MADPAWDRSAYNPDAGADADDAEPEHAPGSWGQPDVDTPPAATPEDAPGRTAETGTEPSPEPDAHPAPPAPPRTERDHPLVGDALSRFVSRRMEAEPTGQEAWEIAMQARGIPAAHTAAPASAARLNRAQRRKLAFG